MRESPLFAGKSKIPIWVRLVIFLNPPSLKLRRTSCATGDTPSPNRLEQHRMCSVETILPLSPEHHLTPTLSPTPWRRGRRIAVGVLVLFSPLRSFRPERHRMQKGEKREALYCQNLEFQLFIFCMDSPGLGAAHWGKMLIMRWVTRGEICVDWLDGGDGGQWAEVGRRSGSNIRSGWLRRERSATEKMETGPAFATLRRGKPLSSDSGAASETLVLRI